MKKLLLLSALLLTACATERPSMEMLNEVAVKFVVARTCIDKFSMKGREAYFKVEYQKFLQAFNNFMQQKFSSDQETMANFNQLVQEYISRTNEITKDSCIKNVQGFIQDRGQINSNFLSNHEYHLMVQ